MPPHQNPEIVIIDNSDSSSSPPPEIQATDHNEDHDCVSTDEIPPAQTDNNSTKEENDDERDDILPPPECEPFSTKVAKILIPDSQVSSIEHVRQRYPSQRIADPDSKFGPLGAQLILPFKKRFSRWQDAESREWPARDGSRKTVSGSHRHRAGVKRPRSDVDTAREDALDRNDHVSDSSKDHGGSSSD